jgi:hypothetical protein
MSLIRFGPQSDVYMYEHVDGFIVCQSCKLGGSEQFDAGTYPGRQFFTYSAAKAHLIEHYKAGHKTGGNPEDWFYMPKVDSTVERFVKK